MPRKKKNRIVANPPICNRFKPAGIRGRNLPGVVMTLDEYEAVRLADGEGMSHAGAAEKMGISRPTFSRLIESARKKTAEFLAGGSMLMVGGGRVHFRKNLFRCAGCGEILYADFGTVPAVCPGCGAPRLEDLAGKFGHGRCCIGRDTPEKKEE